MRHLDIQRHNALEHLDTPVIFFQVCFLQFFLAGHAVLDQWHTAFSRRVLDGFKPADTVFFPDHALVDQLEEVTLEFVDNLVVLNGAVYL